MTVIGRLFICGVLLNGALACSVIEEEDFEHEVDPNIGEGNIYPDDDDTDTGSDTDSSTETETATESDSGTDSATS